VTKYIIQEGTQNQAEACDKIHYSRRNTESGRARDKIHYSRRNTESSRVTLQNILAIRKIRLFEETGKTGC
jgi:hypothetical protein